MTKKILGVDYGDVRTGLAASDELGMMAHGIGTVRETNMKELARLVCAKAEEIGASEIVVGLPVNMDGSHGFRAEAAEKFADALSKRTEIPVSLYDERCTTMAAAQVMNLTDTRGKKRKDSIDTLSAEILLQNYLDRKKLGK